MPAPAALTIVVPCYNERANVAPLVARLDAVLSGVPWEVVFVDDNSPDGTAAAARHLACQDARIRCIRRVGRRGLASAVIEGALSSSAEYVAVMDGDLQHDEAVLPEMLRLIGDCDLVVGSRHALGGTAAGLASPFRHRLSAWGIQLAQAVLPVRLRDPMSGFFLLRRDLFETLAPRLSGRGFKILLDLVLASPRPLRVREVPFDFRPRLAGESKLDALVAVQFIGVLLDKISGRTLPLRFVAFALIGALGVLVNLAMLQVAHRAGLRFDVAQVIGAVSAMGANFALNNNLTYRDQRLRGPRLWRGLIAFLCVCGLGGIANIGVATLLYHGHAGLTPASAAGAVIGVVWNYAVSSTLVWRVR